MKKQHLPIECAENGRKAGRQVLLKLLIMIVCAAAVFGLFDGNADADACTACLQPGLS